MAKNFKGKQEKVKEVKFDTITGASPDGTQFELNYNHSSKRYGLYSGVCPDISLVLSHISLDACKNKATDKEVVWK